jgi:hypothetical protein
MSKSHKKRPDIQLFVSIDVKKRMTYGVLFLQRVFINTSILYDYFPDRKKQAE